MRKDEMRKMFVQQVKDQSKPQRGLTRVSSQTNNDETNIASEVHAELDVFGSTRIAVGTMGGAVQGSGDRGFSNARDPDKEYGVLDASPPCISSDENLLNSVRGGAEVHVSHVDSQKLKGCKRKVSDAGLTEDMIKRMDRPTTFHPDAISAIIEKSLKNLNEVRSRIDNLKILKKDAMIKSGDGIRLGEELEGEKLDIDTSRTMENLLQLRKWAHGIAELAKNEENVDVIISHNAIDSVVALLDFECVDGAPSEIKSNAADVEKEACFIFGLLASKAEHQKAISSAGAISCLVNLLKRHCVDLRPGYNESNLEGYAVRCNSDCDTYQINDEGADPSSWRGSSSVARRAADAITNLAHENNVIKSQVRAEGGIPPLVVLLHSTDSKAQRASAGALRTLAFKNEENKGIIVECGALPTLIFMLRSEDMTLHYEAVGVIGNLVHSSRNIKRKVLSEGALQPVIGLLSSPCSESQRESALLLGQFATSEENRRAIVQRGAVMPLIKLLDKSDIQLKEMAAFALGRLAQNLDNQAGICAQGGLRPLLELLESRNGNLQHNAAFALYGLADNDDNVADIICAGAVQQLLDGDLIVQASKDCVVKTLKRLEERVEGRVLDQLLYLLHVSKQQMKQGIVLALSHLASAEDMKTILIQHKALDVLTLMLSGLPHQQREAAMALTAISNKCNAFEAQSIDSACLTNSQQPSVYLGKEHVNSKILSDVTFKVEGKRFYGHRIALLASSDAFRAMFHGVYKEKDADVIDIPNIRYCVFEAMMTCIYTGTVDVKYEIAHELLQAADQYLLDGLKRLCELAIAEELSYNNIMHIYELAETYHAPQLMTSTILFTLEHYKDLIKTNSFTSFGVAITRMMPEIRELFKRAAIKAAENFDKDREQSQGTHLTDDNGF